MTPTEAVAKACKIVGSAIDALNAAFNETQPITTTSHAYMLGAYCERLDKLVPDIASVLLQAVSAEREAFAALLTKQADRYAAEAKMELNGTHRQILLSKGQAFAEAANAIRARGKDNT